MNRKMLWGSPAFICALLLFCFGCSSPGAAGPTGPYNRIVLDTYDPKIATAPSMSYPTYMELWSSDRLTLIAHDDGFAGSSRPPSALNQYGAYIDYTGVLPSGTYWILIRESIPVPTDPGDSFGYGIRVLTAPDSSYVGWTFGSFASETTTDLPTSGAGIPTKFMTLVFSDTINDRLNRFIVPDTTGPVHGVNWVKLTLP